MLRKHSFKVMKLLSLFYIWILQLAFHTVYLLAKILGLFPFQYKPSTGVFVSSKTAHIYSLVLFLVEVSTSWKRFTVIKREANNWTIFKSDFIKCVAIMRYMLSYVAAEVVVFVPVLFHKQYIRVLNRKLHILTSLPRPKQNIIFRGLLLKAINNLFEILNMARNLVKFTNSNNRWIVVLWFSDFVIHLTIMVALNIFFTSLRFLLVSLRHVNAETADIVSIAIECKRDPSTNFQKMIRFCNLSDRIENIAKLHKDIHELIKSLNVLLEWQLVLVISAVFFETLTQLLFVYGIIIGVVPVGFKISSFYYIFNMIYNTLQVINSTDQIKEESRRLEVILERAVCVENADQRFERNVSVNSNLFK